MGYKSRLSDFLKGVEDKLETYLPLLKSYKARIDTPLGFSISPLRLVIFGASLAASSVLLPNFLTHDMASVFGYGCSDHHLSIVTDKDTYDAGDVLTVDIESHRNMNHTLDIIPPDNEPWEFVGGAVTDDCGHYQDDVWGFDSEDPPGDYKIFVKNLYENATSVVRYTGKGVTIGVR